MGKNVNRATISPIIRALRTQGLNSCDQRTGLTHVTNKQLPMKAGWWDAPLTLWDLAEAIHTILGYSNDKNIYVAKNIISIN